MCRGKAQRPAGRPTDRARIVFSTIIDYSFAAYKAGGLGLGGLEGGGSSGWVGVGETQYCTT